MKALPFLIFFVSFPIITHAQDDPAVRDPRTEAASPQKVVSDQRDDTNPQALSDSIDEEDEFEELDQMNGEGKPKPKPIVRDQRQVETPVSLKADQILLLTNGSYVERQANGTVNVISTNGRVVKTFHQGKIVQDKSGGITILSGKQRVQAGQFKAIESSLDSQSIVVAPEVGPQPRPTDYLGTKRQAEPKNNSSSITDEEKAAIEKLVEANKVTPVERAR